MQRIKNLNGYQKGLLLLMLAMALVFAVVYHMTIARVGVLYQNAIFVPAEENGVTVYSGKLRGKQAEFTVSADKTVSFRCDGQTYVVENGVKKDSDGNIIDPAKPSASDILRLVFDPELTHKGSWLAWFGAVFLSILNAVSILYADELFHWNLSFQIRNAETAEPSDWELMERYLSWTALTIVVLVIYIVGLRA